MKLNIFKNINKFAFVAGIVLSSTMMTKISNAAGLMITPNRIDLNEKSSSKEVKLINKGNDTITYRVSFQHLRMKKDGSYEEIKTASDGEQFVDNFVTYSPKQVTLKPGEAQTVRLMFKKKSGIADGEYRSHMLFKEEASADFGNNVEDDKNKKDKKISVVLKPLFGVTIPVIVTSGNLTANAAIENADLKKDNNLSLKITRSGEASVFGDLLAVYTDNTTNKQYDVGALNNISVFYPYKERELTMKVNAPKGMKLSNGKIEVFYYGKNSEFATDKSKILAKKMVN